MEKSWTRLSIAQPGLQKIIVGGSSSKTMTQRMQPNAVCFRHIHKLLEILRVFEGAAWVHLERSITCCILGATSLVVESCDVKVQRFTVAMHMRNVTDVKMVFWGWYYVYLVGFRPKFLCTGILLLWNTEHRILLCILLAGGKIKMVSMPLQLFSYEEQKGLPKQYFQNLKYTELAAFSETCNRLTFKSYVNSTRTLLEGTRLRQILTDSSLSSCSLQLKLALLSYLSNIRPDSCLSINNGDHREPPVSTKLIIRNDWLISRALPWLLAQLRSNSSLPRLWNIIIFLNQCGLATWLHVMDNV